MRLTYCMPRAQVVQSIMMLRRLSLHLAIPLAVLLLSASVARSDCLVPQDRQGYITEIVSKLTFDVSFVGTNIHNRDRGFALSLFGVDQGPLGQLLLVQDCKAYQEFQPDFERAGAIVRRLQVVCEAAGIDILRVAIASGVRTKSSAFRRLAYDATRYSGTVIYDPFVSADWRTVSSVPGDFATGTAVSRRLIFTPTGGSAVDLTHLGALSASVVANQPTRGRVHVVFPNVTNNGQFLEVDVRIDEKGAAKGTIESDDVVLATVSGEASGVTVLWQGDCSGAVISPVLP